MTLRDIFLFWGNLLWPWRLKFSLSEFLELTVRSFVRYLIEIWTKPNIYIEKKKNQNHIARSCKGETSIIFKIIMWWLQSRERICQCFYTVFWILTIFEKKTILIFARNVRHFIRVWILTIFGGKLPSFSHRMWDFLHTFGFWQFFFYKKNFFYKVVSLNKIIFKKRRIKEESLLSK